MTDAVQPEGYEETAFTADRIPRQAPPPPRASSASWEMPLIWRACSGDIISVSIPQSSNMSMRRPSIVTTSIWERRISMISTT